MVERIPNFAEKARLDALRLECLKLAMNGEVPIASEDYQTVAGRLFDFVTDAPGRLPLWVVRRRDLEGDMSHLSINGDRVAWSFSNWAYRFRSQEDALHALDKHAGVLNEGRDFPPPFTVEQLPDHYEQF